MHGGVAGVRGGNRGPYADQGTLCHGVGGHGRGHRLRRSFMLPPRESAVRLMLAHEGVEVGEKGHRARDSKPHATSPAPLASGKAWPWSSIGWMGPFG